MRTIITPHCRDWAKCSRKGAVSKPETPCSPLRQIKFGSRGSRFSSDAFGYLQAVVPAELTHRSLRFRRPPLQVQSRGKPDAKSRVLTASRAGVNFPVGNCSLRTLVPVVPRMDRGRGKAVRIGCGPATVIGEPDPRSPSADGQPLFCQRRKGRPRRRR